MVRESMEIKAYGTSKIRRNKIGDWLEQRRRSSDSRGSQDQNVVGEMSKEYETHRKIR